MVSLTRHLPCIRLRRVLLNEREGFDFNNALRRWQPGNGDVANWARASGGRDGPWMVKARAVLESHGARSSRRKIVVSLVLVGAAATYLHEPILRSAGHFLVDESPPQNADAIVVLAGSIPDRVLEAVTLYRDGFAPVVVLSKEPESKAYGVARSMGANVPGPHQINRIIAEQLGVPSAAILETGGNPGSTLTEAAELIRFLNRQGFRKILLVTSKAHTRRAGAIYGHLAGGRMTILLRPSRYDGYDPDSWWRDRTTLRRVAIEYEKLLFFEGVDRWLSRGTFDASAPNP